MVPYRRLPTLVQLENMRKVHVVSSFWVHPRWRGWMTQGTLKNKYLSPCTKEEDRNIERQINQCTYRKQGSIRIHLISPLYPLLMETTSHSRLCLFFQYSGLRTLRVCDSWQTWWMLLRLNRLPLPFFLDNVRVRFKRKAKTRKLGRKHKRFIDNH